MGLRSTLDNLEPHFKPGGKYESWYVLYEAVDTIFYSPSSVTQSSAHVRDGIDLKRIMITVWFATFPAMFYGMYNIGLQANDVLALSGGALDSWRGGIVAALGGHDAAERGEHAAAGGSRLGVVECYDPDTARWRTLPAMPMGRSGAGTRERTLGSCIFARGQARGALRHLLAARSGAGRHEPWRTSCPVTQGAERGAPCVKRCVRCRVWRYRFPYPVGVVLTSTAVGGRRPCLPCRGL